MSSKKTTTTNQTQNTAQASQTTPTVPSWIQNPTMNAASQVGALQAAGPSAYTPGISDLQQQATTAASNLGTSSYFGDAGQALTNLQPITNGGTIDPVQAQSLLDNLSAYENPYQDQVINPVLQQYDYQAGQTKAAQAAQAAQGGAFGGSRYGIQEANTDQLLAMGRAQTQGGLLNQMYTQATGLSAQDAAARQAAEMANQQGQEFTAGQNLTAQQANQAAQLQQAGLLTGLGTAQDSSNRANVSLQDQVGSQMTDLQNAIKQFPLQYQAQIESLLSGLNPQMYTGQSSTGTGTGSSQGTNTETTNPGAMGILGGLVQAGSLFAPGLGGISAAGNVFNSFRNSALPT